ncbi:MAG: diphosphate--fructose-6-phosphate 1-phosphotransferase [Deltaproteobacteria bacterium]|nr:diphosphate--fructose-6-phosphate 1-phosphotransferase [Deltaproteobacteria bacterium]
MRKRHKPTHKRLAILVGGGPAPGINGVIRSVTIEAANSGLSVTGILDGFEWLMKGDTQHTEELTIEKVSRIHATGGSLLRTSRANPTKNPKDLQNVVSALQSLKIDYLVVIGGDDTATSAYRLGEAAPKLQVAHVPKTIDNDLPLPGLMPTFGFHTARHYGTMIVQALMEDAKTTPRWYFIVTMGRKAGHLALGIGKASGATVTVIGEEFREKKITLSMIADVLEGAIIKRLAMGRGDGVAILAEGIVERIDPRELEKFGPLEKDPHGNIRLEEIDLGKMLKEEVSARFAARGVKVTVVPKNIGYELRSFPPIPFDAEYTQDLGFSAVRYLLGGGSGAIISIKRGGKLDPIPMKDLLDPQTGKMQIREIDIDSDSYQVAKNYMIRLEKKDFEDPEWVAELARAGKMSPAEFKKRFEKGV